MLCRTGAGSGSLTIGFTRAEEPREAAIVFGLPLSSGGASTLSAANRPPRREFPRLTTSWLPESPRRHRLVAATRRHPWGGALARQPACRGQSRRKPSPSSPSPDRRGGSGAVLECQLAPRNTWYLPAGAAPAPPVVHQSPGLLPSAALAIIKERPDAAELAPGLP